MTTANQFVLINFELKETKSIAIPGAKFIFKDPQSSPVELKGELVFKAPDMFLHMDDFRVHPYEKGTYYELLYCSWPLWQPGRGYPISTSLRAGVNYLNNKAKQLINFDDVDQLKEFLIDQHHFMAEEFSKGFEIEFEEYCKNHYFPKKAEDFQTLYINDRNWLFSTQGSKIPEMEDVTFYSPISSGSLIELSFNIGVESSPIRSHPELNNLKHKIVTDYLKHVIIEPRPMTETAPA